MLKAVIFDAYGTLFDTGTGSVDAAGKILAKCGRCDINVRAFYARWKKLHRYHIDNRAGFVTEEEIFRRDLSTLYDEYGIAGDAGRDVGIMLDTLGKRKAYLDALEAVKRLNGIVRLYIGSTTDTEPLMCDIERSGMVFDGIYTSESLKAYKPEKEFYKRILEDAGLCPEEALFVGDSILDDVIGPKSVGIAACLINRKGIKHESACPDHEINEMTRLIKLIKQLKVQEMEYNEDI